MDGGANLTEEESGRNSQPVRLLGPKECSFVSYSKHGTVRIEHSAVKTSSLRAAYCYPKDPDAFIFALQSKLQRNTYDDRPESSSSNGEESHDRGDDGNDDDGVSKDGSGSEREHKNPNSSHSNLSQKNLQEKKPILF